MVFADICKQEVEGKNYQQIFLNLTKNERETCLLKDVNKIAFLELTKEDKELCVVLDVENQQNYIEMVSD